MRRSIPITLALTALLLAAGCSELEELESSVEVGELDERAEADFKDGDYQAALEAWQEAFELEPDNDETAYDISRAYAMLDDGEAALEWLQRSIKLSLQPRLDSKDLRSLRDDEDYQELHQVLSYAWGDPLPTTNMGGDTESALLTSEGFDLYLKGEYEAALEKFERAYRLDQTNYTAAFDIACVHSLTGQTEEALKWLRTTLKTVILRYLEDHDFDNIRQTPEFQRIRKVAERIWNPTG